MRSRWLKVTGLPWLLRLSGLIIFPILIWAGVDFREAWDTLRATNVGLFVAALAVTQLTVFLRAWRWQLLALAAGVGYRRYWDYLVLFYTGYFAGAAMPQFAASFAPVLFVSQHGHSWRRATLSILLDRLVEAMVVIALAAAAAIYMVKATPWLSAGVLAGAAGVALAVGTAVVVGPSVVRTLAAHEGFGLRSLGRMAQVADSEEAKAVLRAFLRKLPRLLGLTLVILAIQGTSVVLLRHALDLDISLAFLLAAWVLVLLAVMAPISIVGLGPREGILVFLFSAVNEPRESALALGMLLFLVGVALRLPGGIAWLRRTLPSRAAVTPETLPDEGA